MYQGYSLWTLRWLSKVWNMSKSTVSFGYNRSYDMLDRLQLLCSWSQKSSQTDSKNEHMPDWHSCMWEHFGRIIVSDILLVKWSCRSSQEWYSQRHTVHGIRSSKLKDRLSNFFPLFTCKNYLKFVYLR